MLSYNTGLVVTTVAMAFTKLPQPALLYILPTMTLFYIGGAFMRRETIEMLWYDEDTLLQKFEVKISPKKITPI